MVSEPIVYDAGRPPLTRQFDAGTPTTPVRITTNACACSPVLGAAPAAFAAALPGAVVAAVAMALRRRRRRRP
jgi:hypothetical protein